MPSTTYFTRIPSRDPDAPLGHAFFQNNDHLSQEAFEQAVHAEVLRGNVGNGWRQFVQVTCVAPGGLSISFFVAPDYFGIGDDRDWVRTPLTPVGAQRIANMIGCVLPTRKMVDAIYKAADAKFPAIPLGASGDMTSHRSMLRHHDSIESRTGAIQGLLRAGHKKDVVVCKGLESNPKNVAIYGWYGPDGRAIQPLNPVSHSNAYVDYSHGIRFVIDQFTVNDGRTLSYAQVLADSTLAPAISDEGTLSFYRYPV